MSPATAAAHPAPAASVELDPRQLLTASLAPVLGLSRWPTEYRLYFLLRLANRLDHAAQDVDPEAALARAMSPFTRQATYHLLGHQYATFEPDELQAAVVLEGIISRLSKRALHSWQIAALSRARDHVLNGPATLAETRAACGPRWDRWISHFVTKRAQAHDPTRFAGAQELAVSLISATALLRVLASSAVDGQTDHAVAEGAVLLEETLGPTNAVGWLRRHHSPVEQGAHLLRF